MESLDNFLLYCRYAYELWTFLFLVFGISWVMSRKVVDVLHSWKGFMDDTEQGRYGMRRYFFLYGMYGER